MVSRTYFRELEASLLNPLRIAWEGLQHRPSDRRGQVYHATPWSRRPGEQACQIIQLLPGEGRLMLPANSDRQYLRLRSGVAVNTLTTAGWDGAYGNGVSPVVSSDLLTATFHNVNIADQMGSLLSTAAKSSGKWYVAVRATNQSYVSFANAVGWVPQGTDPTAMQNSPQGIFCGVQALSPTNGQQFGGNYQQIYTNPPTNVDSNNVPASFVLVAFIDLDARTWGVVTGAGNVPVLTGMPVPAGPMVPAIIHHAIAGSDTATYQLLTDISGVPGLSTKIPAAYKNVAALIPNPATPSVQVAFQELHSADAAMNRGFPVAANLPEFEQRKGDAHTGEVWAYNASGLNATLVCIEG